MVRCKQARPSLAQKYRRIPRVGFGDHAATDARGGGQGTLRAVYARTTHRAGARSVHGRKTFEVVGRAGLLQPCPQSAQRGERDRRARGVSVRSRKDTQTQRRGRVYGGRDRLDRLRTAHARSGRKRDPRAFPTLGGRARTRRFKRRFRKGTRARLPSRAQGRLYAKPDGTGRDDLPALFAPLYALPALFALRYARGRAARQKAQSGAQKDGNDRVRLFGRKRRGAFQANRRRFEGTLAIL